MANKKLKVERKGFKVPPTRIPSTTVKGYKRKAHKRKLKNGKIIYVKETHVKPYVRKGYTRRGFIVPPTEYEIEDRGAPGRGKKVIKINPKHHITPYAVKWGYITKDQKLSDMSASDMEKFAVQLAKEVGPRKAFGHIQALIVFRKREDSPKGFRYKLMRGRRAITKEFKDELIPKEAVEKWKSMSPEERAKVMPERKRKPGYAPVKVKRKGYTYTRKSGKKVKVKPTTETIWKKED